MEHNHSFLTSGCWFNVFGRKFLTENVYEKVNGKYENRILPYGQHYAVNKTRHYHHLHIQGLKLSDVLTIKKK